jgi:hypothetical protein
MPQIMTASWFAKLPATAVPIGISRGVPRGKKGDQRLRQLEPGPWFKSVSADRYLDLYGEILARLDPHEVYERLCWNGDVSVMLCWEAAHDCHTGRKWCHRHLVAQWLEDRLGIEVLEVGHPRLDRFAFLRAQSIQAPSYRERLDTAAQRQRRR